MIVKNIELKNFRNYRDFSSSFDGSLNVIIGDNAQGKTNLLEAIYYLVGARSFRTRTDSDSIMFGEDYFEISSDIFSEERCQKIKIICQKGRKKQVLINGVKARKYAELSGKVTAVLFSPDDLYIIKEGAAARRRLMDDCISQLRPKYLSSLIAFRRTLEQKMKILKERDTMPSLLRTLEDYDVLLAQHSANLIYYRAHFAESLSRETAEIHGDFSGGREKLEIKYKTVSTIDDPKRKPSELFELIMQHQISHKAAELAAGTCLTGAHKDDLEIYINGKPAKSFASQGQTRTAALSIKLAERQIHKNDSGEYPILLLDDVLSELDISRQNYIMGKITDGQVFITCCEEDKVELLKNGKVLRIKEGSEI